MVYTNITALFNNMRTLKFKAQLTNGFFAAVNQTFSGSSYLPATAEHCFVIWILLNDLITAHSTVVGSWEESPNTWLTVAKNTFVGWALNVRVRMLLKSAVNISLSCFIWPKTTEKKADLISSTWQWFTQPNIRDISLCNVHDVKVQDAIIRPLVKSGMSFKMKSSFLVHTVT